MAGTRTIIFKNGEKVGNFIYIEEAEGRLMKSGYLSRRALFKCICGNIFNASLHEIKTGGQKTCGCFWNGYTPVNKKHGAKDTAEYETWKGMRKRCNNKNCADYPNYGGRGITICREWDSFCVFIKDMGLKPTKNHTLDRYPDKDGNYTPTNCRWATPKQQAINRRNTVYMTLNGNTKTIEEWCECTGLLRTTIESRRDAKWPVEKILTTPKIVYHA